MKNLISFITLSVFLHTTTYHMISTEAKNGLPDPVLDTDGDELRAFSNAYFIRPVFNGTGGGLVRAPAEGFCVFAVAQEKSDTDPGEQVTFFPAGFNDREVVRESTDMNIGFIIAIRCPLSSIWKVDEYEESAKQYFVMLGGIVGNPGSETVSNWFKIEKVASGALPYTYKIVFCPSVCDLCTVACSDVGIYVEKGGTRRLALSDDPFIVRFHKAVVGHKKY